MKIPSTINLLEDEGGTPPFTAENLPIFHEIKLRAPGSWPTTKRIDGYIEDGGHDMYDNGNKLFVNRSITDEELHMVLDRSGEKKTGKGFLLAENTKNAAT